MGAIKKVIDLLPWLRWLVHTYPVLALPIGIIAFSIVGTPLLLFVVWLSVKLGPKRWEDVKMVSVLLVAVGIAWLLISEGLGIVVLIATGIIAYLLDDAAKQRRARADDAQTRKDMAEAYRIGTIVGGGWATGNMPPEGRAFTTSQLHIQDYLRLRREYRPEPTATAVSPNKEAPPAGPVV